MDQFKVYLALLKKHHFWPLVAVILLVGLYAWKTGKSKYDELYATNSGELNSKYSAVESVANKREHPNEFSITEVKKLNSVQTKDVMATWQLLFDNQKQILTWPKEFEEIGRLKPTAPIRENLRQIVLNYFHEQFPKLFAIVDIREETPAGMEQPAVPAADAPAAAESEGGGDGPPPANRMGASNGASKQKPVSGVVVWPKGERERIVNAYRWPRTPGSKQIRYAQEDYWVYEALLRIISETNHGVTDARNAAIKKINALDIAQAVPRPNEQLFPVPEGSVVLEEESKKSGAKPGNMPTDEELDDGRYVSADGKPLVSPGTDNKEFKLMPIRMRLVMDQTKLPDLLVACANSPLPVEVQRWQYRPSDSSGGRATKRSGGTSMGGGAAKPAATAKQSSIARGPVDSDPLLQLTPNDQIIEIRGLIYIFNPPDLGELAQDAGESTEEATQAAEGEPDAPAPAADGEQPEGTGQSKEPGAETPAEGDAQPTAPASDAAAPAAEPASDTPAEPSAEEPAADAAPAEADPSSSPPANGETPPAAPESK